MRKTIDIVTVCKNSQSTLPKLIRSIAENKDSINKFIVIDGNSTDGTLGILKDNLNIVDILVSEEDDGISDAFNKGIKLSNADFILLLNSDDYLIDHSLQKIVDKIHDSDEFVSTTLLMEREGHFFYYKSDIKNIEKFSSVYHPGLLISKKAYEKYGSYDKSFKIGMDYDLIARSYKKRANFRVLEESLVVFADGGASGTNYPQSIIDSYRVRRKYFNVIFPGYEILKLNFKLVATVAHFLGLKKYTTKIRHAIYKGVFE
jgi:glycosyltransferase involved in cell wall biosynthesis